mmetsp:Transcript_57423/g.113982  ORF Transcript_57423/g.113982 Transcript_57423/m.113982 type:complete len:83 (-) Transcript_57423:218-466(-)
MDEHLGESAMLGTDVIRQLRGANIHTPIISCSGNAAHEPTDPMNDKFWEAGANLVWSKPLPTWRDGTLQRQIRPLLVPQPTP